MKFSIKDFLIKCDKIRCFLRIWSYLLKKLLTENFIFCAMKAAKKLTKKFICRLFKSYLNYKNNLTKIILPVHWANALI